jgi:hypothetical protein
MKEIAGFPGYFVTPDGKVYSTNGKWDKSLKQLRHSLDRRGYHRVTLCGPIRRKLSIHRLVAEAYVPNPDNLPQVDHLDGDKHNNCIDNLQWVNNEENASRAFSKQHHLLNVNTGETLVVYNLKKWCRDNDVSHSCLYKTLPNKGRVRKSYKGWKLIPI